MPSQQPAHVPTPEEIQEACREIRSRWSEQERLARIMDDASKSHEKGRTVEMPVVKVMKNRFENLP